MQKRVEKSLASYVISHKKSWIFLKMAVNNKTAQKKEIGELHTIFALIIGTPE
jgi:hypothetical protein